jgi:hypothetical protein
MPGPPLEDDVSISDDDTLWRRVFPSWIVSDENTGGLRVSSAAFDDSEDGSPLSVLIAAVVAETRRTAREILAGYDGYALAAITARTARSVGQGIARTPEPNEPAHASVFGPKTKKNKRGMSKAAIWVIAPNG